MNKELDQIIELLERVDIKMGFFSRSDPDLAIEAHKELQAAMIKIRKLKSELEQSSDS